MGGRGVQGDELGVVGTDGDERGEDFMLPIVTMPTTITPTNTRAIKARTPQRTEFTCSMLNGPELAPLCIKLATIWPNIDSEISCTMAVAVGQR